MLKFLEKIKTISTKIYNGLKSLWKKVDSLADQYCPTAIAVVNAIKSFNESSTADVVETIIETVIPGTTDDKIISAVRTFLKEELPKVAEVLGIVNDVAAIESDNAKLVYILSKLNVTSAKGKLYNDIAAKIVSALSDGKLTANECWGIVEYYYEETK